MPDRALRLVDGHLGRLQGLLRLKASNARQGIKTPILVAKAASSTRRLKASNARQGIKTPPRRIGRPGDDLWV